ncbi:hypothetical protein [Desulfatiglans anilini]|uniref:hypothetical protein n=1 Tax=Desulfatiglans anilini TaxID=90728 RepID=UPI00129474D5|nr:hypothetical protein [Desulfatiglans anilini]
MSKQKLGYLIFDLPSDHEVESELATECKTIQSIIHNKGMRARVKRICVASRERFMNYPTYKYSVQFVHIACHGGKSGIGMLGGTVSWAEVSKQIIKHIRPLSNDEQRIICFSCCHSLDEFKKTKTHLHPYFTGAYIFTEESVPFAESITVWSMFY